MFTINSNVSFSVQPTGSATKSSSKVLSTCDGIARAICTVPHPLAVTIAQRLDRIAEQREQALVELALEHAGDVSSPRRGLLGVFADAVRGDAAAIEAVMPSDLPRELDPLEGVVFDVLGLGEDLSEQPATIVAAVRDVLTALLGGDEVVVPLTVTDYDKVTGPLLLAANEWLNEQDLDDVAALVDDQEAALEELELEQSLYDWLPLVASERVRRYRSYVHSCNSGFVFTLDSASLAAWYARHSEVLDDASPRLV